jgi:hypothetical protein
MSALDDLLNAIFGETKPFFSAEFEAWVRQSRRFKAFATSYQSKIRAKLKSVRDEEAMKDLRAELEAAARLLREERFTLAYEQYAAAKQRGPDFTVTFKTHTPFNIEIRRIRNLELDDENPEARLGKLIAVLCDKVRQMPPSIVNVLWLIAEPAISAVEVNQAALTLRQLADHKVEDFFTRRGFKHAADFLKHCCQLSGVVLPQPNANVLWLNPSARHRVLPEIGMALQRLAAP